MANEQPTRHQHLADAERIWGQRLKMGNEVTPRVKQAAADATYHAIMALNPDLLQLHGRIEMGKKQDGDAAENKDQVMATPPHDAYGQDWYAMAQQQRDITMDKLPPAMGTQPFDPIRVQSYSELRAENQTLRHDLGLLKRKARYDLVQLPGEDFTIGLSKTAPVGVKIMVFADEKQYVLSKGVDHITVSELG